MNKVACSLKTVPAMRSHMCHGKRVRCAADRHCAVPEATLQTYDGWPNIYCANAVALPRAFESDELAGRQISSIGNITAMDEELGPGHVINDESVTSRRTYKISPYLACYAPNQISAMAVIMNHNKRPGCLCTQPRFGHRGAGGITNRARPFEVRAPFEARRPARTYQRVADPSENRRARTISSVQKFSNTSWKVSFVGSSSMYSLPLCL